LGDRDIRELILSPRLYGFSLFPVNQWPCPVYISRILDETVKETLRFTREQIEMIGWGMIFRTLEESVADASQFRDR